MIKRKKDNDVDGKSSKIKTIHVLTYLMSSSGLGITAYLCSRGPGTML